MTTFFGGKLTLLPNGALKKFYHRKEHPMKQILSIYNGAGRTHSLPCKR